MTGLVHCSRCGARLGGKRTHGGTVLVYGCNTRFRKGKEFCGLPSVRKETLEHAVANLVQAALAEGSLQGLLDETNRFLNEGEATDQALDKQRRVEGQLAERRERLDRLYEAIETGHVDMATLGPRIQHLKQEVDGLESRFQSLRKLATRAAVDQADFDVLLRHLGDLDKILVEADPATARHILGAFIRRAELRWPVLEVDLQLVDDGPEITLSVAVADPAPAIPIAKELAGMRLAELRSLAAKVRPYVDLKVTGREVKAMTKAKLLVLFETMRVKLQ